MKFVFYFLFFSIKAFANPACAVCTVTIIASLNIARKLGVQDSVVGLWSGALLVIMGYWMIMFFDKKKWNFKGRDKIILISSVASIGFIFLKPDLEYMPRQILFFLYLDPILFSTILGSLVFVYSQKLYQWMKKRNGGHAHFPFEKVVMPLVALLSISYYFQFIKF